MESQNIHQSLYQRFKQAVKTLKKQILTVYYALNDPDTPLAPKLVGAVALAYALSPLDLIPDFVPILGLLDDLIILPALLWATIMMIPPHVMERARHQATTQPPLQLQKHWGAALCFFLLWNAFFAWMALAVVKYFGNDTMQQHRWWVVGGTVTAASIAELIWSLCVIQRERSSGIEATQPLLQAEAQQHDNGNDNNDTTPRHQEDV